MNMKYDYRYIIGGVSLFVIGYFLSVGLAPEAKNSTFTIENGLYYRVVFIGSTSCPYSVADSTIASVQGINKLVAERAKSEQARVHSIGIAVDKNKKTSFEYLLDVYQFDEVVVGGSWINTGARKYIWDDFQGEASTPQIIITKISYDEIDRANYTGEEVLLYRTSSAKRISELHELLKKADRDSETLESILSDISRVE